MNTATDEEKIMIRFEGQTHQVDVNTLTSSLLVFSEALKGINKNLRTGKKIEINIEALKPGSFEIHSVITAVNDNDLFSAIATVGGVITPIGFVYTGIVKLRSWLKKRENREIDSINIEGDATIIKAKTGNTFVCSNVVYNIYQTDQAVNDAISDQFRITEEDPAIDGLTISTAHESVSIPKRDFSDLAEKVDITNQNKKREVKERQAVYVVKPVLEKTPTRRWEFIWHGNKISANIIDIVFLEKVEQGEFRFGTGDTMIVDLQINQVLSPVYDTWLNESYQITLVHEHLPRGRLEKPLNLFDPVQ